MPLEPTMPLDELLTQFESLGDNCEFGLVQRAGGAEPLGLLRFAGFYIPIEERLSRMVSALDAGFAALGAPDTVTVTPRGNPASRREFIVDESSYNLMYHSGVLEGDMAEDAVLRREYRRLAFLVRKLLDDLTDGRKIWVWRSHVTTTREQVEPLLECLGRRGPNTLLWVCLGDADHPPGTVERLDARLLKGYVERFAPYHNAPDISVDSWFTMCRAAHALHVAPVEQVAPAIAVQGPFGLAEPLMPEAPVPEPIPVGGEIGGPSSSWDILRHGAPEPPPVIRRWFSGLLGFGRRR